MAAAAVAAVVQAVASTAMNGASVFGVLAPITRAGGMAANGLLPNDLPPIRSIMSSWHSGHMDTDIMSWAMNCHGVFPPRGTFPADGFLNAPLWSNWRKVWDSVHAASVVRPGVAEIIAARQRGLIGDDATDRGLKHLGYYHQADRDLLRELGQEVLPPDAILTALNRGLINQDDANKYFIHAGVVDNFTRATYIDLRFQLPGPADLVAFGVKEIWDQAVVDQYGYDDDFPDELQYWMDKQGAGGDSRTPAQVAAGGDVVTWPEAYWRAHWQPISPGQAYEMFHRLRPNRIANFQQQIPGVEAFGLDDVRTLLKVADYPSGLRDRLTAIAYRLPRIRDVQQWYDYGIIDGAEVQEIALDYGYSPIDAARRRSQVETNSSQRSLSKLNSNPSANLLAMYDEGFITSRAVARGIYAWSVIGTRAAADFAGLNEQQQGIWASQFPQINALIAAHDMKIALAKTKRAVGRIKRMYQRGMQDSAKTKLDLIGAGVLDWKTTELMNEWNAELQSGKLLLSTAFIRRLVVKQVLPMGVAFLWLENLGWGQPEIRAIMMELQRDLSLEFAKAQGRVAKTLKQQQAAFARQAKAAQTIKNQAIKKLMATLTPAKATRYYIRGVFSILDLQRVLLRYNYVGVALVAALADAKIERESYVAKKAKAKSKQQSN